MARLFQLFSFLKINVLYDYKITIQKLVFYTNLRREIAEPSSGDRHTVLHTALRNTIRNTMRNVRKLIRNVMRNIIRNAMRNMRIKMRNTMRNMRKNMRNHGHVEKRGKIYHVVLTCTISPGLLYLEHSLLATLTRPKSVMIALPFSKKIFFVFKS